MKHLFAHKSAGYVNNIIVITLVQIILFYLSLSLPTSVLAQASEYTVKVVLFERFARFVAWPEESPKPDTTQPFVIGVIGKNPFGTILEDIYTDRKIQSKKVKIRYITEPAEIGDCRILFIPKSEEEELSKILYFTKKKPILTVSDTRGFAQQGVLINLYLKEDKVRFEINEAAVKESGLTMSHLLLRYGDIINHAGEKK